MRVILCHYSQVFCLFALRTYLKYKIVQRLRVAFRTVDSHRNNLTIFVYSKWIWLKWHYFSAYPMFCVHISHWPWICRTPDGQPWYAFNERCGHWTRLHCLPLAVVNVAEVHESNRSRNSFSFAVIVASLCVPQFHGSTNRIAPWFVSWNTKIGYK